MESSSWVCRKAQALGTGRAPQSSDSSAVPWLVACHQLKDVLLCSSTGDPHIFRPTTF
uniref:Uncharacterized protein n=1 Tax=Anguilla anguilla TaxID=7936 RepID=A0A0E9VV43_ANGAN